MTSRNDLDELELWGDIPHEHRLASMIDGLLAGEKYEENLANLATTLGYTRPEYVKHWLNHTTRIPLRHLPAIGEHLNIGLGVLAVLWLVKEAPDGLEEMFYRAVRPRVTNREFTLIEKAREVYIDDEEDAAEDNLIAKLR